MNLNLLYSAESKFLTRYPGGFENPEMLAIAKKHKMELRQKQAREWFALEQFLEGNDITKAIIKMVNNSSLVSVFEKPKFKDAIGSMSAGEKQQLADSLQAWIHGDAEEGFNGMLETLLPHKNAKWPIMTVIPTYFRPEEEVFIKPTTAKNIIAHFGIEDLKYTPKPNWEFYRGYRDLILEMKSKMKTKLTENNPAFCGFLMTTIQD